MGGQEDRGCKSKKRNGKRGHWTRLPANDGVRENENKVGKERKKRGEWGKRAEREAEASSSPRRISRARRESRERVL